MINVVLLYFKILGKTLFLFQSGMCSVFLPEEERVVNILGEHLEPVTPVQGDRVKVSENIVIIEDVGDFSGKA